LSKQRYTHVDRDGAWAVTWPWQLSVDKNRVPSRYHLFHRTQPPTTGTKTMIAATLR